MMARTRTVPDHLAHRPVRNGLVVPWVTIWSAEMLLVNTVQMTSRGVVARYEERRWGLCLMALPNNPAGRPEWRSTHSSRQRRCMFALRCQVCGNKIEGLPTFIIPQGDAADQWSGEGLTKQPPVCEPCLEAAMVWCPHLAHVPPSAIVRGRPRLVGMTGDVMDPLTGELEADMWIALDAPPEYKALFIGRELIVAVEEC